MIAAVPRAIDPPDRATGRLGCQRMEHRKNRSHAHSGAQEYDGTIAAVERECAAGLADVEHVAGMELRSHIGTGDAVRLLFYRNAITVGPRSIGKRVAAQNGRRVSI